MPEGELRVVAPDVGGGFGQKMSLVPEYVVLVWLARRLKSSVAWTEDRRENLIASFHSRDQSIHLQGAFASLGHARGAFPVAERAAGAILSLPLFPEITAEQQECVAAALRRALA